MERFRKALGGVMLSSAFTSMFWEYITEIEVVESSWFFIQQFS